MFEGAIEQEFIDLQALIMFLVFEKQVLTMEDDSKELDLYFLDKHNERMNYELKRYKQKMNMKYGLSVYRIESDRTYYIAAENEAHAVIIANRHGVNVDHIQLYDTDTPMMLNESLINLRTLLDQPRILGGNEDERYNADRQLYKGY